MVKPTWKDTCETISFLNELINWERSQSSILAFTKERRGRVHVCPHPEPPSCFLTDCKLVTYRITTKSINYTKMEHKYVAGYLNLA